MTNLVNCLPWAACSRISRIAMISVVLTSFLAGSQLFGQGENAENGDEGAPVAQTSDSEETTSPVEPETLSKAVLFALIVGLFLVPMFLGGRAAKSLRMPDHSWKFSLALFSLATAAIVCSFGDLKFGPDLSGGSTLIFELDSTAVDLENMNDTDVGSLIDQTITALTKRVDPSGTKEVTIRKYGQSQIEIIIPRVSDQELAYIEEKIYTAGILEFRVTASPVFVSHKDVREGAEELPVGRNVLYDAEGNRIAQWLPYDLDSFTQDELGEFVVRKAGKVPQILVMYDDGFDITGKYLETTKPQFDRTGSPSVGFTFDTRGSLLFGQLTGKHSPNASGQKYHLGIVLDNVLISAPNINERISGQGEISGIGTQDEVDKLVDILRAGSLPAQLSKEPISRETISPTLGAETVEKGKQAIGFSLLAVMVFMLIYYRFAGIVACFALGANLLLIVGTMMLVKAAFTLPGLAGLVLTIGMSVDANVLIFERIREERRRGAALRMAIRNGFGRATQTIVDANVTTLITAAVIYRIAPDNVKGFGVTLIIGILMSMFSAIFLSRLIFDIAEKMRGISELKMAQIIGQTKIDFLGKKPLAYLASVAVIGIGIAAVTYRGDDLLNIDFTGGSSVTMVFKEDQKMEFTEVKEILDQQTDLAEKNLTLVEVGETKTQYTVSCVEQDVAKLQQILAEAFGERLQTYHVQASDVSALGMQTGFYKPSSERIPANRVQVTLASFQQEEPPAEEPSEQEKVGDEPAEADASTSEESGTEEQPETEEAPKAEEAEVADETPAEEVTEEEKVEEKQEAEAPSTDEEPVSEAQSKVEEAPKADEAEVTDETPAEEFPGESTSGDDRYEVEEGTEEGVKPSIRSDIFEGGTQAKLKFGKGTSSSDVLIGYDGALSLIQDALDATGNKDVAVEISHPDYVIGSARRFGEWDVKLALPVSSADQVFEELEAMTSSKPVFPLANKIGGRVASDMKTSAIAAILISLLGIVAYIWFRFQRVEYGLAAVVALVHDVLVTLGMIALSAFVVSGIPGLAELLMIEKFQISLPIVAAFLTIIGYSLNDTIVVFDRIREVKGKSPKLTAEAINTSINQTLARTLLTSLTTLLSVILLYALGGDGIHGFAFALVIGVIVGTYSSIFIASPALLWMSNWSEQSSAKPGAKAA